MTNNQKHRGSPCYAILELGKFGIYLNSSKCGLWKSQSCSSLSTTNLLRFLFAVQISTTRCQQHYQMNSYIWLKAEVSYKWECSNISSYWNSSTYAQSANNCLCGNWVSQNCIFLNKINNRADKNKTNFRKWSTPKSAGIKTAFLISNRK